MILQALNSYYERLESDPHVDIARFGYSQQKFSFEIVLESNGKFFEIVRLDSTIGKRQTPMLLIVPGYKSRSGRKPPPNFLWDKPAFLFGIPSKDSEVELARRQFEAFREFHNRIKMEIGEPDFSAVCSFLSGLECGRPPCDPSDLGMYNGVFRIRDREKRVYESQAIKKWWRDRLDSEIQKKNGRIGQCMVFLKSEVLAPTHDPPLGSDIPGAENSAKIVSFNFKSAESLGKNQSYNSPVSIRAAFQYSTALKWLCRRGSRQKIQIGDTTTIFWTERPTLAENLLPWVFEPTKEAEDETAKIQIESLLQRVRSGDFPGELGAPETPFYVLGLSPNVARISIRFWHVSTLGEFIANLNQHFEDLRIVGDTHADLTSSIRDLLSETVPLKNGWPDQEKISPQLAGEVTSSVLQGRRYPRNLMLRTLHRVLIEGFVDAGKHNGWRKAKHRRAAVLKACVNREYRSINQKENIVDTYLNKIHPHSAYQCGRLMAVLALVQERALNTVNSTVVRRFLSAASRAPALHLGRLQVQAEVGHLPKLPGEIPGFLRDEMKQINGELKDSLPSRLDALGQSLFILGFYQQLAHLERQLPEVGQENRFHLHRTSQGEWVRSKGEQQVANCLAQLGIKYHYEPCVFLKEGPYRIPDFFIPGSPESNRTFIEYLGMDTDEYNERWEQKLAAYEATDILATRGANGRLIVLDCRKEPWDDAKMLNELRRLLIV